MCTLKDKPGFDISEIHKYLKMIDGWEVKSRSNIYYLIKILNLKIFQKVKSL